MNKRTTKNNANKKEQDVIKQLCEGITSISDRYSPQEIFEDWLAASSVTMSSPFDSSNYNEYCVIATHIKAKYNKKEILRMDDFYQKFATVYEEEFNKNGYTDVLGRVYASLRHTDYQTTNPNIINNKVIHTRLYYKTDLNNKSTKSLNFIALCDHSIGSGSDVLEFCNVLVDGNYNLQEGLCVLGGDEDINNVYISYLQMSILDIPSIIFHGNSLTEEKWSTWSTPKFICAEWDKKLLQLDNEKDSCYEEYEFLINRQ